MVIILTDRQVKNLIERIYLSQHDQEKREALKIVYNAFLKKSPCDLCAFDPPSSMDGKPCTACPAAQRMDGDFE